VHDRPSPSLCLLLSPQWRTGGCGVAVVGVAQLVERRVVVANVAGSSPVTHPTLSLCCASRGMPMAAVHGCIRDWTSINQTFCLDLALPGRPARPKESQ